MALLLVCILVFALGASNVLAAAPHTEVQVAADYNVSTGIVFHPEKVLNIARGGHLINTNLNWMPAHYDTLRALGVRKYRMDWMLSDTFYAVVSRAADGQLQYDFSKLDRIVLPLLERGITPMMGMTQLPAVIRNADGSPSDEADYEAVIAAYVRHYADLGYTGLYWESDNEPETFTKIPPATTYNTYEHLAAAVKRIDPTANVGGYSAVGLAHAGYIDDFVKAYAADLSANPGAKMDFFSFHQYDGESFAATVARVTRSFTQNGIAPGDIPPYHINEWNEGVGHGVAGGVSDSSRNAAFVAAMMADAARDPHIEAIYYWNVADAWNPHKLFSGDYGLLTIDGHRKAPANVYTMFTRMSGEFLTTDSLTGVSRNTQAFVMREAATGNVALVLWNHTDAPVTMQINLTSLPYQSDGRNVKLSHYRIDAQHGNYYHDYVRGMLGTEYGPSEEMAVVTSQIVAGMAAFTRAETLPPQSVAQYLLEPTTAGVHAGPLEQPRPPVPANLAAAKKVTVSSCTAENAWSPNTLTDSVTNSFANSNGNVPLMGYRSAVSAAAQTTQWVEVDFGGLAAMNLVKLYPVDYRELEGAGFPVDFTIQGSRDGQSYDTLHIVNNYNNGQPVAPGAHVFVFPNDTAYRYIRLQATQLAPLTDGRYALQLNEIKVYATAAPMVAPAQPPVKVNAARVDGAANALLVVWENPAPDIVNAVIERSTVERPEDGWKRVGLSGSTTFTDAALRGGLTYSYRVTFSNPYGVSATSEPSAGVAIPRPDNRSEFTGEGAYLIRNLADDYVLVLPTRDDLSPFTKPYNADGEPAQVWKIINNHDGTFHIKNALTGKVLQSWGATSGSGDTYAGFAQQKFSMIPVDSQDKIYYLCTADNMYLADQPNTAYLNVERVRTLEGSAQEQALWYVTRLAERIELSLAGGRKSANMQEQIPIVVKVLPPEAKHQEITLTILNKPQGNNSAIVEGKLLAGEPGLITIGAVAQDEGRAVGQMQVALCPAVGCVTNVAIAFAETITTQTPVPMAALITSEQAYIEKAGVAWTVTALDGSPTTLAAIDPNGVLTPHANGVVRITATSVDGVSAVHDITINRP